MKVAIAGYGAEGKVSAEYWRAKGAEVTIVDESETIGHVPEEFHTLLGPGVFNKLDSFGLVIRAPGVDPRRLKTTSPVSSATNEFFSRCPAPIIGVTGTKGKGTVCSLIAAMFIADGRRVHLVGNIGAPALAELANIEPNDVVVYELSSFQLWDAEFSPTTAVVLMIEEDHLDIHSDMADYVEAKRRIVARQSPEDIVFYHPTNKYSRAIAETSHGMRVRYASAESVVVRDDSFWAGDDQIASTKYLQLVGWHNLENACAAIAVARHHHVSIDAIVKGMQTFKGLPHRLQFVAEIDGVRFYDDSISTTSGSAIAALGAFESGKVIILGGSDKGADFVEVVEACKSHEAKVVAVGAMGERVAELCAQIGVVYERVEGGMQDIVAKANDIAHDGDVVILSPAAASFDMYMNYADRGEQFIEAVKRLGR
jgi:UDP-N-acetylmuramoylalanine--D-glutamate ligase